MVHPRDLHFLLCELLPRLPVPARSLAVTFPPKAPAAAVRRGNPLGWPSLAAIAQACGVRLALRLNPPSAAALATALGDARAPMHPAAAMDLTPLGAAAQLAADGELMRRLLVCGGDSAMPDGARPAVASGDAGEATNPAGGEPAGGTELEAAGGHAKAEQLAWVVGRLVGEVAPRLVCLLRWREGFEEFREWLARQPVGAWPGATNDSDNKTNTDEQKKNEEDDNTGGASGSEGDGEGARASTKAVPTDAAHSQGNGDRAGACCTTIEEERLDSLVSATAATPDELPADVAIQRALAVDCATAILHAACTVLVDVRLRAERSAVASASAAITLAASSHSTGTAGASNSALSLAAVVPCTGPLVGRGGGTVTTPGAATASSTAVTMPAEERIERALLAGCCAKTSLDWGDGLPPWLAGPCQDGGEAATKAVKARGGLVVLRELQLATRAHLRPLLLTTVNRQTCVGFVTPVTAALSEKSAAGVQGQLRVMKAMQGYDGNSRPRHFVRALRPHLFASVDPRAPTSFFPPFRPLLASRLVALLSELGESHPISQRFAIHEWPPFRMPRPDIAAGLVRAMYVGRNRATARSLLRLLCVYFEKQVAAQAVRPSPPSPSCLASHVSLCTSFCRAHSCPDAVLRPHLPHRRQSAQCSRSAFSTFGSGCSWNRSGGKKEQKWRRGWRRGKVEGNQQLVRRAKRRCDRFVHVPLLAPSSSRQVTAELAACVDAAVATGAATDFSTDTAWTPLRRALKLVVDTLELPRLAPAVSRAIIAVTLRSAEKGKTEPVEEERGGGRQGVHGAAPCSGLVTRLLPRAEAWKRREKCKQGMSVG